MSVAVPLLLAVLALASAVIRRWRAIGIPLVAIPLFYAGLVNGWWGDGVGDGWPYAAAAVTALGVVAAVVGVLVGLLATRVVRRRATGPWESR